MIDSNAEFLRALAVAISPLGHNNVIDRLLEIADEMDALDALMASMGL